MCIFSHYFANRLIYRLDGSVVSETPIKKIAKTKRFLSMFNFQAKISKILTALFIIESKNSEDGVKTKLYYSKSIC